MSAEARDWRNDPTTPANLKPIEKGLHLAPRYLSGRREFEIKTADWRHVTRATFGPARPVGQTNRSQWTGRSHRYDIYRFAGDDAFLKGAWGLRWSHGGGDGWLVQDPLEGELSLFEIIARVGHEGARWDACHAVCEALDKTVTEITIDVADQYRKAFAEGRLKKRRRHGKTYVELIPAVQKV